MPKTPKKTVAKKAAKKRKKKTTTMYFTQETEDAIVEYNSTDDPSERERIYNDKIFGPFSKLAENVYNTFKFSYFDISPADVQMDVVSFLTSNLSKYKARDDGGSKAFSYFSIVAKNWLILNNNSTYKRWKQHTEILQQPDEDVDGEILMMPEDNSAETMEFINLMIVYWEKNIRVVFSKPREITIANAVIELFRMCDRLENFNKKALYLYIREISGCKTQHITKVINKMKDHQNEILQEYLNDGVVSIDDDEEINDEFFESQTYAYA
jgi:hypothetical protein